MRNCQLLSAFCFGSCLLTLQARTVGATHTAVPHPGTWHPADSAGLNKSTEGLGCIAPPPYNQDCHSQACGTTLQGGYSTMYSTEEQFYLCGCSVTAPHITLAPDFSHGPMSCLR